MPMMSRMPAAGRPNIGTVAATTTSEARGTPAMPLLVTIMTRSIITCSAKPRWMPKAWAMNRAASAWYIIEPSRLNE